MKPSTQQTDTDHRTATADPKAAILDYFDRATHEGKAEIMGIIEALHTDKDSQPREAVASNAAAISIVSEMEMEVCNIIRFGRVVAGLASSQSIDQEDFGVLGDAIADLGRDIQYKHERVLRALRYAPTS